MELKRSFLIGEKVYLQSMDAGLYDNEYLDWVNWVNDDEIVDNMTTLYLPTTEEALRDYIKVNTNKHNIAFFAIRLKENNDFIGTIKLGPIDWVNRKAYYGRLIGNKSCIGKGIGTEVVRLILRYGFKRLNLHWIGTGNFPNNIASIKSNEKAGLKKVAAIPNQIWSKGKYVDCVIMGITSEEYFGAN